MPLTAATTRCGCSVFFPGSKEFVDTAVIAVVVVPCRPIGSPEELRITGKTMRQSDKGDTRVLRQHRERRSQGQSACRPFTLDILSSLNHITSLHDKSSHFARIPTPIDDKSWLAMPGLVHCSRSRRTHVVTTRRTSWTSTTRSIDVRVSSRTSVSATASAALDRIVCAHAIVSSRARTSNSASSLKHQSSFISREYRQLR